MSTVPRAPAAWKGSPPAPRPSRSIPTPDTARKSSKPALASTGNSSHFSKLTSSAVPRRLPENSVLPHLAEKRAGHEGHCFQFLAANPPVAGLQPVRGEPAPPWRLRFATRPSDAYTRLAGSRREVPL